MFLRVSLFILVSLSFLHSEEVSRSGEAIYGRLCVDCHGARGEGVENEYDEPLYGNRTVEDLAKLIHKTMPEDEAELCVDDDAANVAQYVYDAFYSAEARARNQPVRVELARLTAAQYKQSVADLVGSFRSEPELGEERGLRAEYYDDRNRRRNKRKINRVDPEVQFAFGTKSPDPESIQDEAFAIEWEGGLIVEESGDYEFCVTTENGFKLYVNSDADKALIDGWVSSGTLTENRVTLPLLGGHVYPIRLEYFKFKEKSASIELRWKPPHGVETVIPEASLAPIKAPPVMVVSKAFPADDRSMGYVRGTAVSKAWHEATTSAAVEVADHVVGHLSSLVDAKTDSDEWPEAVRSFCSRFVERAFRRPLSDEERAFFVDSRFGDGIETTSAVKRVVLLALKSPRFLFPEVQAGSDAKTVASRLALILRDTLPTKSLRRAAKDGRLKDREAVREMAARMLDHPETRAKLQGFFDHWLHIDEEHDLSKDPRVFPDFDRETIADLRRSLTVFIDGVVWSESSDYRQLLLADYLYINEKLANFFGHGTMKGKAFRKVQFDSKARSGVLTHPYLLARFAYHQTTSPIHRGVFMTRNVLGRSLKPPPEAVRFEDSRFDPHLTMREKVTDLTKSDSCMTCHAVINPLGFSLERFDAVGRYRFMEKERAIDTRSLFQTLDGRVIALDGARDVAEHAASSPEAQRGFIQHLFEHLVKQPVNAYALETIEQLHRAFEASEFNIKDLMIEIATVAACHRIYPNESKDHDKNA